MRRQFIRLVVGTYRRKAFGTDKRAAYPPAALVAFYGVLELAAEQPTRGTFESLRLLKVLLEGPKEEGRLYARQVDYLIRQHDLIVDPKTGTVAVDGWDAIQEGDLTVADRVTRFRNRHGNGPDNGGGNGRSNGSATGHVTPLAGAQAPGVDVDGDLDGLTEDGDDARDIGLADTEADLFALIAKNGAYIRPDSGLGVRLVALIDRRGIEAVLASAHDLSENGRLSDRQWVLGLENRMEDIPRAERTAPDTSAVDEARDIHTRKVQEQMQRRRIEAYRFTGKWDEAFGPEPEWQPEWGAKPKVAA